MSKNQSPVKKMVLTSGKTVLLRCICGLTRVTSGEVTVNGKIVGRQVDFPDNIGMIIETPGFLPNYSGYKNLDMLACYRKKNKNYVAQFDILCYTTWK